MGSVSRDREREQLEQELRIDEYQRLLWRLQKEWPFLRRFRTWGDTIAFMRNGTSSDPRKDEVLCPIIEAHGEDQDPHWRTILLVIFWPGLASIHFKKRHWDPDPDERWAMILWTFHEVICRIDVTRRSDRWASKVINDVYHHLHDEYRRVWDHMDREKCFDGEELQALVDAKESTSFAGKLDCCVNFETLGLHEEMEAEIRRLREHLEADRINEADYFMLLGTKVYRQSIADYARDAGLRYQTIRKRHQRAESAIRRVAGEKR